MGSLEEILARLNALESENRELKSRVAELQGLRKSAKLKPGNWDATLALGRCLLAQGRPAEAAGAFREAIRLVREDFPEEIPRMEEWLGRCG